MTPQEFTEAKARLGWTYAKIAKVLHVDERTARRWAKGESKMPGPAAFSMQALLSEISGKTEERAMSDGLTEMERAADREAEAARMSPEALDGPDWESFGRAVMENWAAHYDVDAGDKFEWALKFGLLKEVDGGFDPEKHIAEYCDAERGDDWYELNYAPERKAK